MTSRISAAPAVVLSWPERLRSGDNAREHWTARARRSADQRQRAAYAWIEARRPKVPAGAAGVVMTFTRIAPRRLDDGDGIASAFKAIRDEVVECFGFSDDSARSGITFRYEQKRGGVREHAVRVRVEWEDTSGDG